MAQDNLTQDLTIIEAQLFLGQRHLDSDNWKEAFAVFEAAARSGDARALNMLGRCYERSWGVRRDAKRAAVIFAEAVKQGNGWAMFNLADLYINGDGVERNTEMACSLYTRAAEAGVAKAMNMLGLIYEDGEIWPRDLEMACSFYRASAEAGDCWGSLNMARLLLDQWKIDQAVPWLRRALENGFPEFRKTMAEFLRPLDDPRLKELRRRAEAESLCT